MEDMYLEVSPYGGVTSGSRSGGYYAKSIRHSPSCPRATEFIPRKLYKCDL